VYDGLTRADGQDIAAWFEDTHKNKISTAGILFAGGFSALPGTVVMVPGERVKLLLQIQGQSTAPPKYNVRCTAVPSCVTRCHGVCAWAAWPCAVWAACDPPVIHHKASPPRWCVWQGFVDCVRKVVLEEGLAAGLYKGSLLTLLRDIPGSMANYVTYAPPSRHL
jgi:hypothetical protein